MPGGFLNSLIYLAALHFLISQSLPSASPLGFRWSIICLHSSYRGCQWVCSCLAAFTSNVCAFTHLSSKLGDTEAGAFYQSFRYSPGSLEQIMYNNLHIRSSLLSSSRRRKLRTTLPLLKNKTTIALGSGQGNSKEKMAQNSYHFEDGFFLIGCLLGCS